jgi:hypothetical protein
MTLAERFNAVGKPMPVKVPMTRIDLAKLFATLGYREGAEVGVFVGEYSEVLLRAIPHLHLRCVDSWAWSRQGERGRWNTYWASARGGRRPREVHEENYKTALTRLAPYSGAEIMRMLSHEAAALVPDGALDFAYIDAEHTYEGCLADLRTWSPKVRKGGIVSGDDYRFVNPKRPKRWGAPFRGVDKAVDEFVVERGIREWFYTSDVERTILGVRYAEKGRAFPSFFWGQL